MVTKTEMYSIVWLHLLMTYLEFYLEFSDKPRAEYLKLIAHKRRLINKVNLGANSASRPELDWRASLSKTAH